MTALQTLYGFSAWTLLLVTLEIGYRASQMAARRQPINAYRRGASPPVPDWVLRVHHAHLNCLENLPLFAVLILGAVVSGKEALITGLATWVLVCRVLQTLFHLSGVSSPRVALRATMMAVQWTLFAVMMVRLWKP